MIQINSSDPDTKKEITMIKKNDSKNMEEIVLNWDNASDPDLKISPYKRTFGMEPEIEEKQIRLRIGKRPIVRNLRTLYEINSRSLPEDLELFVAYDIWMITHVVSIVQASGFRKVKQLGYQVNFPEDPKITVLEVLPQTQFVKKIGTSCESITDIQLNGQAQVPQELTNMLDQIESISFNGKLAMSNSVNIVGRLSFSIMTPIVQAVGKGDDSSEWIFTKDEKPLLGDQLMVQIILTPKFLDEITFQSRVYATISTFNVLPVRLKSDWITIQCELQ